MDGNLFIPGANGKFSRQGNPEFSVKAKTSKPVQSGMGFDIKIDGNPEIVCKMIYDAMAAYPEVAKVILTTVFKFCVDKGIPFDQLKKHTYFNQ